jgi:hypothetical protein
MCIEVYQLFRVPRLVSLVLLVLIGASCSPAPENVSGEQQPSSTRSEHSVVAKQNKTSPNSIPRQSPPADAISLSSFVGEKPNFVMFVRWEEFGSAQIRGKMRVTEVAGRCPADHLRSSQLNAYQSHFKGTRDRSTVFLNLSPQNPAIPSGTWVGGLAEAPKGVNASERPALRLRDPDGDRILLFEGTDRDYADAVARLAEDCGEGTLPGTGSGQS